MLLQCSSAAVVLPDSRILSGYIETVNSLLSPAAMEYPTVLDLFSGAGGLSLGFEACGFRTHGIDDNEPCCCTYARNLRGTCTRAHLNAESVFPPAEVLVGGPPCQPFSVGGKQRGRSDPRDELPVFVTAVAQLLPKLWILENVKGLLHRSRPYLEQIISELRDLGYVLEVQMANAAGYGVPQNRERLIIVGHHGGFTFPKSTAQTVTAGEALSDMATLAPSQSKFLTPAMDEYIARYEKACGLSEPRDLHLDRPARTLTARNLAGATGDMQRVLLPDGRRRRLLIREAARLQSFPDWFEFSGTDGSQLQQIGNAVPPLLAYHLAKAVAAYLGHGHGRRTSSKGLPR